MNLIRIESHGPMGQWTRVLYCRQVDGDDWFTDPEPVDISDCVASADIHIRPRELTTADLRVYATVGVTTAMKRRWRLLRHKHRTDG